MPNITRFAVEGLSYDRATTNYPATLLALGGVASGLSPIELTLAEKPPNIIKAAKNKGVQTHAIFPSSGWFSKKSVGRLVLDHFEDVQRIKTSEDSVTAAIEVMRNKPADQRLLMWLHLYDPHHPYRTHPQFAFGDSTFERYKSEVAATDTALAPLFKELKKSHWAQNTTIVFFADHGESLGEYVGHHVYLNRAIADIPMIVRAPGVQSGRTQKVAATQDVTLTVRHALGLDATCGAEKAFDLRLPSSIPSDRKVMAEAFSMRGSTLFRFLNTPARSKKAIEARLTELDRPADYEPKTAVISSTHRAVFHHRSGRFELYDRRSKLEKPVAPQSTTGVRKQMKSHLRHWMQTTPLRAACLWR